MSPLATPLRRSPLLAALPVLALALTLALGPALAQAAGQQRPAAQQAAFPDLTLEIPAQDAADLGLPAAGRTSLSRMPAQALLVLLVSYFCPPCHKEVPRIKELARRIQERGLAGRIRMVGLAAGDDKNLVEQFKTRHGGLPFPLVPDPDLAAHRRLGSPAVPVLYAVARGHGGLRLLLERQGEFVEAPDAFLDAVLRALDGAGQTAKPQKGK